MKAYNNSVMELKNLSLFTDYAKMEGMEIGRNEGIQIGEKKGEKRGIEIGKSEGIQIGKSEGIQIGRNEGIEIAQVQIVIGAADKGISVEDISGFTGLSVERISDILKNRNNG
jgi:predicted transposase YdaD